MHSAKNGNVDVNVDYRGLRDWIDQVNKLGELQKVNGAHWDREMGAITQMLTESGRGKAPAIVFDEVPGYPKGYRTLYGQFSTTKRVALTLGLPLEYERKADIVKAYHHVMADMKLLKPKMVKTGPIFDNVLEGDKVDVLKLRTTENSKENSRKSSTCRKTSALNLKRSFRRPLSRSLVEN